MSGLGGSAPLSVSCGDEAYSSTGKLRAETFLIQIGAGVIGDCWRAEERGKALALYSLAPLLGPSMGPLVGAWIAQKTTWRWVVSATKKYSVASADFFLPVLVNNNF